jgi:hypothetical protein
MEEEASSPGRACSGGLHGAHHFASACFPRQQQSRRCRWDLHHLGIDPAGYDLHLPLPGLVSGVGVIPSARWPTDSGESRWRQLSVACAGGSAGTTAEPSRVACGRPARRRLPLMELETTFLELGAFFVSSFVQLRRPRRARGLLNGAPWFLRSVARANYRRRMRDQIHMSLEGSPFYRTRTFSTRYAPYPK